MALTQRSRTVLTLYSSRDCVQCHRARLVLAAKGVVYDLVPVNPDSPPEDLLDLNPYNTVPTLVDQTLRFDGDGELVRQVRLGRHPNNTTRIVLEAAGVSSFSVYPLYSPYRLVIDCIRPVATMAVLPPILPPAIVTSVAKPLSTPRALTPPPLLRSRPVAARMVSLPTAPAPDGAALLAGAAASAAASVVPASGASPLPALPVTPLATAASTARN